MPAQTVHCSVCGASIQGYDFSERMGKLRRHRNKAHAKSIRKSVKGRRR